MKRLLFLIPLITLARDNCPAVEIVNTTKDAWPTVSVDLIDGHRFCWVERQQCLKKMIRLKENVIQYICSDPESDNNE